MCGCWLERQLFFFFSGAPEGVGYVTAGRRKKHERGRDLLSRDVTDFFVPFILINLTRPKAKFLLVTLVTSNLLGRKARHLLMTLPRGGFR